MKQFALFAAFAAACFVSGCAEVASDTIGGCGGSAAQSGLEELVEKNVSKLTPALFQRDEFVGNISSVQVKRSARTLKLEIEDARTMDDKARSAARECRATAKLTLPSSMIESVEQLLVAQGRSLDDLAGSFDGELRGQSVYFDIEYEVQPTDDASKVITETATDQGLFNFSAAFVALQLRSPEASRQIADAAAEQAQIAKSEQDVEAATQQAEVAAVEEARTESRLARQTINAIWSGLEPGQRRVLLERQRAWLKRKQADCNLESASSSIDPELKAIAYLKCDTRVTNERIDWLRNNAPTADSRTVGESGPWLERSPGAE